MPEAHVKVLGPIHSNLPGTLGGDDGEPYGAVDRIKALLNEPAEVSDGSWGRAADEIRTLAPFAIEELEAQRDDARGLLTALMESMDGSLIQASNWLAANPDWDDASVMITLLVTTHEQWHLALERFKADPIMSASTVIDTRTAGLYRAIARMGRWRIMLVWLTEAGYGKHRSSTQENAPGVSDGS